MTFVHKLLAEAGYTMSGENVWGRADFAGIAYSDGDSSEDGLLSVLRGARDVSVFSPELRAACTDWPSFYHLSNERANLLRPFAAGFAATTRVLEIGAGCGAVTRFLGETGAQVLALEGSRRRAIIARERVRDLENVHVLAERFQDFAPRERFDAITLVGVLEYASVFSESAEPALDMLRKVRAMLAPGGSVFLAIENKFGLKYLAGAPEDHLGAPMVGVEGRYSSNGVRTWGRVELEALLTEAGFAQRDFHVPMPDYKTPVSIIGPSGIQADPQEFDAGTLAAQAVRRDRQLGATTFNLQRAWTGIANNRLLLDLGNSFLVRAGVGASMTGDGATLAWHYSTQRSSVFARESRFVRQDDGSLAVHSRALSGQQAAGGEVRMRLSDTSAYHCGPLYVEEFRAVLTKPGWSLEQVVDLTGRYLKRLCTILAEDGIGIEINDPEQVLPDHYIDATPFNLLSTSDGRTVYFDREWEVSSPTLGWLTLRSLLFTYAGTTVAPMQPAEGVRQVGDLVRQVLCRVYPDHGEEWVEAQLRREADFQSAVTGVDQQDRLREVLAIALPAERGGVGEEDSGRSLAKQLDLISQSLHAGVSHVGDRVGSVLEQQDAMSQSLHAGVSHVGDRVGSVLEQQDAISQSLHVITQGINIEVLALGKEVARSGRQVGEILEQLDTVSQSLHAVTLALASGIQGIQADVVLANERADGMLKQLDAVSQSLHAVVGRLAHSIAAIEHDARALASQQLATQERLEALGSDMEQLKGRSIGGILHRISNSFRRART